MKLKIFYMTFGCKVNQYETRSLAEGFAADGHERTENISQADVCIVNSCTVTESADTKCRKFIRRVKRQNPDCILLLTGCFAQAFPTKAEAMAECDIICANSNKPDIPKLLYGYLQDRKRCVAIPDIRNAADIRLMKNTGVREKTRAYIKIEDGCERFCSYCIIPYARGRVRSKPIADIVSEAAELIASGHREIVLTGINLGCYGMDLGGVGLCEAAEAVCALEGDFRLRLGSLEPELISDEDIEKLSKIKKLCPQFHLSLQSGCDKTLKAMNRRYTAKQYYDICQKLRQAFENAAITTDIMVGFPGETEEDHRRSLEFAESVGFAAAHIFPYSKRAGTAAAGREGQVDEQTKNARAAQMAKVCRQSQLDYNKGFIGRTVSVLFERESCEEYHQGHMPQYVSVKVPRSGGTLFRCQKNVLIESADSECCYGKIIE